VTIPAAVLQLVVFAFEMAAKYGPGLLEVGENVIRAIESHGELSPEEKAALIARVRATRAKVAAYEPRPKPIPDPDPTPRGG